MYYTSLGPSRTKPVTVGVSASIHFLRACVFKVYFQAPTAVPSVHNRDALELSAPCCSTRARAVQSGADTARPN